MRSTRYFLLAAFLLVGCRTPTGVQGLPVVQGVPVRMLDGSSCDWPELENVILAVRMAVEELYSDHAPRILATEIWVTPELELPGLVENNGNPRLLIQRVKGSPLVLTHLYAWHLIPHILGQGWNSAHSLDQQDLERAMRVHLSSVLDGIPLDSPTMPPICPSPLD